MSEAEIILMSIWVVVLEKPEERWRRYVLGVGVLAVLWLGRWLVPS